MSPSVERRLQMTEIMAAITYLASVITEDGEDPTDAAAYDAERVEKLGATPEDRLWASVVLSTILAGMTDPDTKVPEEAGASGIPIALCLELFNRARQGPTMAANWLAGLRDGAMLASGGRQDITGDLLWTLTILTAAAEQATGVPGRLLAAMAEVDVVAEAEALLASLADTDSTEAQPESPAGE